MYQNSVQRIIRGPYKVRWYHRFYETINCRRSAMMLTGIVHVIQPDRQSPREKHSWTYSIVLPRQELEGSN